MYVYVYVPLCVYLNGFCACVRVNGCCKFHCVCALLLRQGKERGKSTLRRGFWCDVITSPYYALGIACHAPKSDKAAQDLFDITGRGTGVEQWRHVRRIWATPAPPASLLSSFAHEPLIICFPLFLPLTPYSARLLWIGNGSRALRLLRLRSKSPFIMYCRGFMPSKQGRNIPCVAAMSCTGRKRASTIPHTVSNL